MKNERQVNEEIVRIMMTHNVALQEGPAKVPLENYTAVKQIDACARLDMLYWMLDECRPRLACDKKQCI